MLHGYEIVGKLVDKIDYIVISGGLLSIFKKLLTTP